MNYEALASHPGIAGRCLLALSRVNTSFTPAVLNGSLELPAAQPPAVSAQLLQFLLDLHLIEHNNSRHNEFRVASPAAQIALQSLSALVGDGSWTPDLLAEVVRHQPGCGWQVPDLIRLEQFRLEVAARTGRTARPLRHRESALLIVKKRRPDGEVYLLVRRNDWSGYSFIGGKFEAGIDKTLTDTARREVGEELHLDQSDFVVKSLPLAPVSLSAISQRKGVLTEYTFQFFQLFAAHLQLDPSIYRWFHQDEIRPKDNLTVETFGHLAYPEIQQALWRDLPGGLAGLPSSDVTQK